MGRDTTGCSHSRAGEQRQGSAVGGQPGPWHTLHFVLYRKDFPAPSEVSVGVCVRVGVSVSVRLDVGVGVCVRVGVSVRLGVRVGVGVGVVRILLWWPLPENCIRYL